MNIANNIIKHYLKNVYFLGGTSCGGKTTMSKIIAEKYGFIWVEENSFMNKHNKIANEIEQPNMTKKFTDWETYFNRPPAEYSQWHDDLNAEAFEMLLIDLIILSQNQKVIVDLPPIRLETAKLFTEYNRIAFLITEPELIIKDQYSRDDHQRIYNCIMGLSDPQKAFDNVNAMTVYGTNRTLEFIYNSGFYYIKRDENSTVEKTLVLLEKHFNL